MNTDSPQALSSKENIVQAIKFFVIAASGGFLALGISYLMAKFVFNDGSNRFGPSYFVGVVCAIIFNFTINRKYTFKSAANVPIAMLKLAAFHCVWVPLAVFAIIPKLEARFLPPGMPASKADLVGMAIMTGTMMTGAVLEFLYQRFVIYRGSINSAEEKKERSDEA